MNYDEVILTEAELKEAILEGKKKKFFKERSKDYWEAQEQMKKGPVKQLMK
jgi:hypothetical protein